MSKMGCSYLDRSCENSRFGYWRSKVTTQTSQGLPYSNLQARESRCVLSNCQPYKINQRDENPLCHSSPPIKVLPPEGSCRCRRWEVTRFTLAEPLWPCHSHTGMTKSLYPSETCTGMASSYMCLVGLPELCRR